MKGKARKHMNTIKKMIFGQGREPIASVVGQSFKFSHPCLDATKSSQQNQVFNGNF